MALRRIARAFVRRSYRRFRRYFRRRRPLLYRRSFRYRRFGRGKARALKRAGNLVRYTAKNNVNTLMVWPVQDGSVAPGVTQVTWTPVPLIVENIFHANRQFARNMMDYAWMKFNYVGFKITDVCHIAHDVVQQVGNPPVIIPVGVNSLCGKIPVNANWDVDQDFCAIKGCKGIVDPEGFAQHPGTKQIRPDSKRPVSFVWRFPKPWRQFLSTDSVRGMDTKGRYIEQVMAELTGIKNIRAPTSMFYSIPDFWAKWLPDVSNPGVAIKTYVRADVYLGCTFRGRRLMDDGTCTKNSCA